MPNKEFELFIGIDQTGAIKTNGHPKSLPLCVIFQKKTIINKTLPKLSLEEIKKFVLENLKLDIQSVKTLICIDSVMTLPAPLNLTHRQILQEIKNYSFENKPYGALTAFHFFNSLNNKSQIESRTIEKQLGANSVFKLKPFQKNIGCGSYRILKDLSLDPDWYQLWPVEKKKVNVTICEGYPSYYWKLFCNLPTRNLSKIKKITQLNFKNQDFADSFILAKAAQKLGPEMQSVRLPQISKIEGWVLGA